MKFETLVDMAQENLEPVIPALPEKGTNTTGLCLDCEEEIPEGRQAAMPGVDYCLECQETVERLQRKGPPIDMEDDCNA